MEPGDGLETFFQRERQPLRSAADVVADVLRKAIERGVMAPGSKVEEEKVAQQLNVSRMPVRQAVKSLEAEGLVRHVPHSCPVVTELSADEVEEIYHIRAALEILALRRAVPRYTEADFRALHACLDDMARSTNVDAFLELNTRFHVLLYSPSGWRQLIELIERLRRNVTRYTRLSITAPGRFPASVAEHRGLLAKCEERDADAAAEQLYHHLFSVANVLISQLRSNDG